VPHSRNEWIVFVAGLLVIGFLVAEIVVHPSDTDPGVRTARQARSAESTQATNEGTTTHPRTTTLTRTVPSTTTTVRSVRLRLRAKADTWLLVRRTSRSGQLVYQGTLIAGDSRSFTGTSFSVRFGAAANVAATLNGKPLPLPSGTYSVSIGRDGLGPRSA
jgi:hypothetical protein